MNVRKIVAPVLFVAMIFSLMTSLSVAQQDKNKTKQQAKQQEKVFIPKEIKAVLLEGLASRQGRQDISVNVSQTIFLPAQQNFQIVFFLKIKNSDLGYAPAMLAAPEPAKPDKKGPQETPAQEPVAELQADFNVFLQFNRLDEAGAAEVYKEIYVPTSIKVLAAGFDLEKEDLYSVGYPLPTGHYLLAMALTSRDLQKIGTAYIEFTLPDPAQFSKTMDTTPIFFVKQWDQMESVEQRTVFHKGYFTYAVLKLTPNLDRVFTAGENLDVFFYIFGTQPNPDGKNDLEIDYEVKKGEETAIRWALQTSSSALISQPLPLKQTVKIKTEKEERTETRDLPAGSYTLFIKIVDKISQLTLTKTIDFEMK
ncbi:MAG: hypothetical protein AB1715_11135 [Acidobacteriota bacterium]